MESEDLKEEEELEKIKQEIALRKSQEKSTNFIAMLPNKDTSVMDIVKQEENELLKSEEFQKIGKKFAEERAKSDLSAEASRIRRKNIETSEHEFENETRELKLKHLKAEMELEHRYNMMTIDSDAKHKQTLAYRKKLVEKFGYLYDCRHENCVICHDDEGNEYSAPKDFSYSITVNKIRQFGRNLSKLDRPILQTIKWVLIIGLGISAYFILKSLGVF